MEHRDFNYVITDYSTYDASKLEPIVPGDHYYLLDKATNNATLITSQDIRNFYPQTLNELHKILNDVIAENVSAEISSIIFDILDEQIKGKFLNVIDNLHLVTYKGEASIKPTEGKKGEVYAYNGIYYLFYEDNKASHLFPESYISAYLSSYYTSDEQNEVIQQVSSNFQEFSESVFNNLSSLSSNYGYVTKDEFIAKYAEYSSQINKYRSEYELALSSLTSEYNNLIDDVNKYKNDNNNIIAAYIEKYRQLQNRVNVYQQQISVFKQEIINELDYVFGTHTEIKQKLDSLLYAVDSFSSTLNNYTQLISSMAATIQLLSDKLSEILAEEQRILKA